MLVGGEIVPPDTGGFQGDVGVEQVTEYITVEEDTFVLLNGMEKSWLALSGEMEKKKVGKSDLHPANAFAHKTTDPEFVGR